MRGSTSVYQTIRKDYEDGHLEPIEFRDRMVAAVRQGGGNTSVRVFRGLLVLCRGNDTFYTEAALSTHLGVPPSPLRPFIDSGIVEVTRGTRRNPLYRVKPEFKEA